MNSLSNQIEELRKHMNAAAGIRHGNLLNLEAGMIASDDAVLDHMRDIVARAHDRRAAMHSLLTEAAALYGIHPVRPEISNLSNINTIGDVK